MKAKEQKKIIETEFWSEAMQGVQMLCELMKNCYIELGSSGHVILNVTVRALCS